MVSGRKGIAGTDRALALATVDEQAIELAFVELHARVDKADEDDLLRYYNLAGLMGKQAWVLQSHILARAKEQKAHHNDGAIIAVARQFGLSKSQASQLIKVWETYGDDFAERGAPDDRLIGVSWYKTAVYTKDPEGWIRHVVVRKQQNPSYRVQDLRVEIEQHAGVPPAQMVPAPVRALPASAGPSLEMVADMRDDGAALTAQDMNLIHQYHRMVNDQMAALQGTGALVHQTSPELMADLLGPPSHEEILQYNLLTVALSWLRRVATARKAMRGDQDEGGSGAESA